MGFDLAKPQRRSIRLARYDYTEPGAYFVTVCAWGKKCLFGKVVDGEMQLNRWGESVRETWDRLPRHYPYVELDAFVIMPNHVHGIIFLVGAGFKPALLGDPSADEATTGRMRAGLKPAPTTRHELPEIIRAFKTFSARRINERRRTPGIRLWQRNNQWVNPRLCRGTRRV
jgi:hypothetical protein